MLQVHVEIYQYVNAYVSSYARFCLFPDFIWRDKYVVKDRQQDPPSLPLARPEQELNFWLLIRSCYYADYLSKAPGL